MDSTIKALHKNVAEWLAGPAGAVIFHLLLLVALLFLVDFSTPPKEDSTIAVTVVEANTPPLDPTPPALAPPPPLSDLPPEALLSQVETDLPPPPEMIEFTRSLPQEASFEIPPIPSAVVLHGFAPGSLHGRLGEGQHAKAGMLYGGERWVEAEAAVKRALEWLRLHQNAAGSWGTHDPEAMTGLGLLTFLAHGETTASEKYGATVKRALQYLVARQNAAGEFANPDTTAGTYAQAICVYALSEAYGMTRILDLKPAMEKGVAVLIQGQQAKGGFDYRFEQGARRDTSLGGWCSQALKAAFIAGAEHPRLKAAMDLAVADMKSAQKEDGSFVYSAAGSHATPGITAVAVLSMQLLDHGGATDAVKSGLAYLRSAECQWKNPPNWPMYAWYYISQTKFHQGGASWTSWNNQFAPQFIRHQNPDGSWTSAGLALKAGTTGRENMHPVYATTLAALTLQVYYRCLPTYKPIAEQTVEKTSDDVHIQVL